ncbi:MAG TPA: anti-sigma factor [Solirubrobacteraceae bacterium]|nr:anti-sigma factor [Solirubrobacteraceae bacterium]
MSVAAGHEDWADTPAAYLLGALPDGERLGFEAHLAECGECHRQIEHLRVAIDALPVAAPQVAPPPELKDRIMAVVNAEAELLRAAGAEADRPPQPRRGLAILRPRWWSLRPGLAVGAAMAVLAIGVFGGLLGSGVLDDGGAETRRVVAQVDSPNGTAHLVVREGGDSTLVTRALPRPEPGRVYQVWVKRPGRDPEPTDALFTVRPGGVATVNVPGSLEGVERVMVTSEPDGGSLKPTRDPVVVATLS